MNRTPRNWVWIVGLGLVVGVGRGEAAAQVVCGAVITTEATMTADLDCATEPGLTIGAGGELDMAGFTLSCDGTDVGIELGGSKAKLANGVVEGCNIAAVNLGGSGGHKVSSVLARNSAVGIAGTSNGNKVSRSDADNNTDGFSLIGDKNALLYVAATRSTATSINLAGNKNKIVDSVADNSGYGVTVTGDGNKLVRVVVSNQTFDAVTIAGIGNKLTGNTAVQSGGPGFYLNGDGNKLTRNFAIDNNGIGIWIDTGSGMALKKNLISGSGSNGIFVGSNGHSVAGNSIYDVNGTGIYIDGVDNSIANNVALRSNAVDFEDATVGCANEWRNNAGIKGQTCID